MACAASETGVGKGPRLARLAGSFLVQDSLLKKCKPGHVVGRKAGLPDDLVFMVYPSGGTDEQRGWVRVGLQNMGSSDVEVESAVITLAGITFTDGEFRLPAGLQTSLTDEVSLDEWRAGLKAGVGKVWFELVIKKQDTTRGPPQEQPPVVKNTDIEGRCEMDAVVGMEKMSVSGTEAADSPGAARERPDKVVSHRERLVPSQREEDHRDLSQLLEFIQGDDGKEQEKKKKKKKPKRKVVVQVETLETEAEDGLEAENPNVLEAEAQGNAQGATALEADVRKALKHEEKAVENVHHGGDSTIVGGCKKVLDVVKTAKTPYQKLFESVDKKIGVKERELECPVCLEIASVPIFMCDESHIICSSCFPELSQCPECRQPYPDWPRRHRYAERAAQELEELRREMSEILGD